MGSKRTNHKFGCFGEVCQSNILIPSKIPFIRKCVFLTFIFFFKKGGGPWSPRPSPCTGPDHVTIANSWQLESMSIFCINHVMCIALLHHLIIPPLSILNISNDMCGWGGQPWEGFDHTYFGAGFGKPYILTGTHEALFIKIWTWDAGFFCLSVRNSENCHDSNIPFSSNAAFS